MIEPAYIRTMARYNTWQNNQLMSFLKLMPEEELMLDRGAFFGSIMSTINHLLWGDMLWLNRFDPTTAAPQCEPADGHKMFPTIGTWSAERFRTDGLIRLWAERVKAVHLHGDLSWYSGAMKQDFSLPLAMCIMQFFNHQTHHRGQVHAMLTATGRDAPVTDLVFMPEDM